MFERMILTGLVFCCVVTTAPKSEAQEWRGGAGCAYFADRDFRGASFSIAGNGGADFTGRRADYWNDRITAIQCSPGCVATVFRDSGYRGATVQFRGYIPYVGNSWNDAISSIDQRCGGGYGGYPGY